MKTLRLVFLVCSLTILASCGSSKKVATHQGLTATARDLDPCIVLAQENVDNLRAYGTAVSYVERVALRDAETDARIRLASMMNAAINGAALDYQQNAQTNAELTTTSLTESVTAEFVNAEVKNTRVIKTSIYDMSDRSVKVYVCLEMLNTIEETTKKLDNYLSSAGVIKAKQDRDKFIDLFSKRLAKAKSAIAE